MVEPFKSARAATRAKIDQVESLASRIADAVAVRRIGTPFGVTEAVPNVKSYGEAPVMVWFLEDYRDDVVLMVRVQHFELALAWLAVVLEGAPAVPAIYCDQGADAAAVASRVRVTRVLPGDTVDVGEIRILIDFIDVADDA